MTLSLVGKRLGNYDIQAKIGEGGMGLVYLGIHPQIGKKVAVKVLHEELCGKADVVARFFNEAKAVNDISHPNIVDIIDFGETMFDGSVCKYIIMEYLDGESLAARMRREGVTIRETVHIIASCGSALAASHAKGVVHRDLKPENVYLCTRPGDRNYVKLLDFGIAKLTAEGNGPLSQHTRTGMVIGTPTYMSPEQCDGKGNIDNRADIYALGVMMYELLTGRVPFPGDGFGEVLVAHLTREPEPPSQLNKNIPPELEAIVLRCLRKKKEERFQSMNDMIAAIFDPGPHYQTFLRGEPAPVAGPNVPQVSPGGSLLLSAQAIQAALASSQAANSSSQLLAPNPMGSGAVPVVRPSVPSAPQPQQSAAWGALNSPQAGAPINSGPVAMGGRSVSHPGVGPSPLMSPNLGAPLAPGPRLGGPLQSGSPAEMMPVAGALSGPRPTTLQGASGEASRPRRPLNVMIGFASAIVLGVLSVVMIKLVTRQPPPVAAAVVERVQIVVKTTPERAEVLRSDEDGKVAGQTPYTFAVKKGAGPIELKLKLAGYKEELRSVEPTADRVVEVELSKLTPEPTEPTGNPVGTTSKPKKVKDAPKAVASDPVVKEPKAVKEPKVAKEPKEPKEPKAVKEPKVSDPKPAVEKKPRKGKKTDGDLLAPVF